ncbi:MAG: CopD family protein [Oligoflexales bacterium]
MNYLVIKSLHIVSIISWMAGVLYLFRIFVYATEAGYKETAVANLLKTMAYRLYRYITVPAMVLSWIFGLAMLGMQPDYLHTGWFGTKLLSVIGLTVATFYGGRIVRKIAQKEPLPTSRALRFLNEVPTLLMVLIVFMVILKPF